MTARKLIILLIEDLENDVFFVQEATRRGGAGHTVYAVPDGQEAIRYLRGEAQYSDRQKYPLPNVILTDLKMPRMNGFEFISWVRAHPECSVIPTIVYTSSDQDRDVKEAYRLGANAYMTKPHDLNEMVDLLRTLCEFWSRCECPPMPFKC